MRRRSVNYIDKPELLGEMIKFREAKAAKPGSTNGECMSPRLTEMLMLLVNKIATADRWNSYTPGYVEEMKSDAYLRIVQVIDRFNPEKSDNAYGYFTTIIWRTFKGRVETENSLNDFVQQETMKVKDDFNMSWNKQAQSDMDKYGDDSD